MNSGRIILDINQGTLEKEEEELLENPLVAGVILFKRNYKGSRGLY